MANYILIFIPALAAIIFGAAFLSDRLSRKTCIALRLDGIRINNLTKQLLLDLQQHRGMVNAFLSGDKSFKQKIENKQAAIKQDLVALNTPCSQKLITAKRWEGILGGWERLSAECLALPVEDSFQRHCKIIRTVLYSIGDIAERSQINGVFAADFALVDTLWGKIPAIAEGLGQTRAVGSSVAAKGNCTSVARIKLRFLEEHVRETMAQASDNLAHIQLDQATLVTQTWQGAQAAVREFLVLLEEELINAEAPAIDAEHFFNAGTKALDAVFLTFDHATTAVENSLNNNPDGKHAA